MEIFRRNQNTSYQIIIKDNITEEVLYDFESDAFIMASLLQIGADEKGINADTTSFGLGNPNMQIHLLEVLMEDTKKSIRKMNQANSAKSIEDIYKEGKNVKVKK